MKFAIAALLGASSAIKINYTAGDDGSLTASTTATTAGTAADNTAPMTATTAGIDAATTAPQMCNHPDPNMTAHGMPAQAEALECYKQGTAGSMYAAYMATLPSALHAGPPMECHWECQPVPQMPDDHPSTAGPGTDGLNGLPAGEVLCPNAPTAADISPQCSSQWIVVDHASGQCGWTPCQAEPAFTMPTRDEQIKQFANGFFGHCDMDHDKILTMDELRQCLTKVRKMMKDEAKEQVKMQRDMIMNQTQQQVQALKQMGKMIYQGATEGKTPVPDGISMSDVLDFLQAPGNFEQVGAIMNGGQDHGNSGDSGDSGPEMCGAVPCNQGDGPAMCGAVPCNSGPAMCGAVPCNQGDGPAMCGADPCTSPHDIAGGNANGTNGTANGTYGA